MAYEKRIEGVDTPVGTMRLAGRDQQDINAATAAPSATGGAPTTITPTDKLMREVGATNMPPTSTGTPGVPITLGPDPGYDPNHLNQRDRMNFQQSAAPQPILPQLQRKPVHTPERYAVTNPELVQQTETFVQDLMDRGHAFDGFRDAGEVAKYLHAAIYTAFEPHLDSPMPLADLVHQTREGRGISEFIRRGKENRVRYGGRAL